MPRRCLASVGLAVLLFGCDSSSSVDIKTPGFAPAAVLRAVLAADRVPTVRVTVSRDPYGAPAEPGVAPPTPAGAVVSVWRDGVRVETLAHQPQTCYRSVQTSCNAETGRTETDTSGPYDCGAFRGTVPIVPGATYTVRAEVPGLPSANATVAVPVAAALAVADGVAPDPDTRSLGVTVTDVPGPDSRFGLIVLREYDRFSTSICRRGGLRDTTIVLVGTAYRYQDRFGTADPVLLADATDLPGDIALATFRDATFRDGRHEARLTLNRQPRADVGGTGRLTVQLAVLSTGLYDAYRVAGVALAADNPFTEPADLPSNVVGGYGRVEAVALSEATVEAP